MPSAIRDQIGNLHIVTGTVLYTSGAPAVTSNDPTVTVAGSDENATITFGDAFTSAPHVCATIMVASHLSQTSRTVEVETLSTTTAEFRLHDITDTGANDTDVTNEDPADSDGFSFIAIGVRDN